MDRIQLGVGPGEPVPTCYWNIWHQGLVFRGFKGGRHPLVLTGAAVGLVSFIGYTPDVFMGPLMGVLLDGNPGAPGHHHVFMLLAGFSLAGLAATIRFKRFSL